MWKKSEPEVSDADPVSLPETPAPRTPERPRGNASIGPSISIRGDVTGEEDLVIEGRIEGTVKLPQNNVTVGKDGRIKADVHARVIEVQGQLEGDLNGDEQVVLRRSSNVQGNIVAPRVTLEDGCRFRGSIDMEPKSAARRPAEGQAMAGPRAAPQPAAEDSAGRGGARTSEQPARPASQKISGS